MCEKVCAKWIILRQKLILAAMQFCSRKEKPVCWFRCVECRQSLIKNQIERKWNWSNEVRARARKQLLNPTKHTWMQSWLIDLLHKWNCFFYASTTQSFSSPCKLAKQILAHNELIVFENWQKGDPKWNKSYFVIFFNFANSPARWTSLLTFNNLRDDVQWQYLVMNWSREIIDDFFPVSFAFDVMESFTSSTWFYHKKLYRDFCETGFFRQRIFRSECSAFQMTIDHVLKM